MSVCDKCGLPEELCICEEIAKESQRVRISTDKRRFGKLATIVDGINDPGIDLKELSSLLKAKCACGGTIRETTIELQGDHKKKVREILEKLSERDRRLLREVFLEERNKDEVCRDFGVDREYLRVLLHRAKQAFKSSYLKHSGDRPPDFAPV